MMTKVGVLTCFMALLLAPGCKKNDDAKDREIAELRAQLGAKKDQPPAGKLGAVQPAKAAPAPAPAEPSEPAEGAPLTGATNAERETIANKLAVTEDLAEAVELIKPAMADTVNEPSTGGVVLALWASGHLKWGQVAIAKNETSLARVLKDSEAERGKRMCIAGDIIQITKERGAKNVFSGLISAYYSDSIVSFMSVGSTGELVSGSRARICGVTTGRHTYSNAGGGTTHAVAMVGMFDLPENKPQVARKKASHGGEEPPPLARIQ